MTSGFSLQGEELFGLKKGKSCTVLAKKSSQLVLSIKPGTSGIASSDGTKSKDKKQIKKTPKQSSFGVSNLSVDDLNKWKSLLGIQVSDENNVDFE